MTLMPDIIYELLYNADGKTTLANTPHCHVCHVLGKSKPCHHYRHGGKWRSATQRALEEFSLLLWVLAKT